MAIIPFHGPSPQSKTPEQRQAFSSLNTLKGEAANSVGYFVALGKRYKESGVFQVDDYVPRLAELLPNCGGRTVKGYANLVWFTEQVSRNL